MFCLRSSFCNNIICRKRYLQTASRLPDLWLYSVPPSQAPGPVAFRHRKTNYSCGTVQDSHLFSFSKSSALAVVDKRDSNIFHKAKQVFPRKNRKGSALSGFVLPPLDYLQAGKFFAFLFLQCLGNILGQLCVMGNSDIFQRIRPLLRSLDVHGKTVR